MLTTTVGRLIVNEALPPEMRNYSATFDKKTIAETMQRLAELHPDKYREVSQRLLNVGRDAAYSSNGYSFGVRHLRTTLASQKARSLLNGQVNKILAGPGTPEEKESQILEATSKVAETLPQEVYAEALAAKNPLAMQVKSGARGSPANLNRLIGADLLYVDHRDNPIPFPVTKSYGEGVSMADYFAASFGARKGLVDVKLGTAKGGFFGKQLNQLSHRLLVTASDEDEDSQHKQPMSGVRGLPVTTDDDSNVGALLARGFGPYKRNTVITPRILADLQNLGFNRILVRSPTVGGPESGGVFARDVGIREKGILPANGELVGLAASQALSERLTQGALGSKHSGGTKGSRPAGGFGFLNQMIQVPETFKGGAAHSQRDGRVERIVPAPAGGSYVIIDGEQHYVGTGFNVKVKPGQEVEAGDVLSDGIPNPAEIVKHKGIGEGRRYFVDAFREGFKNSGIAADRRNVELVARGLIDYVEMTDEMDDYVPGDVVPYNNLERTWQPREGFRSAAPQASVGKYLERPVLHYSIGTKIRKSMLPDMQEFGVNTVDVHDDPPPFQPQMLRALDVSGHDPDWMSRLLGSYQKKNILDAVHRGRTSDEAGTSFVPALARGVDFGKTWPQSVLKPK